MSNSSYSLIGDLYGTHAESDWRRPEPRSHTWLVVVMILGGLFLYESVQPVPHLRTTPPAEFVQAKAGHPAPAAAQQDVARSYWSLANDFVAHKYAYGEALPSKPPADFTLASGDATTRAIYWQRFRTAWNDNDTWTTSYEFNTDWVGESVVAFRQYVRDRFSL